MLLNQNAVFLSVHAVACLPAILCHNYKVVKEPIGTVGGLLGCEIFLLKFHM